MIKKMLFMVLLVLIPAGLKAQEIIKCDTTQVISIRDTVICDTNWAELVKFLTSIDTTITYQSFPNWQDSIEQCKKSLEFWKEDLRQRNDFLDYPEKYYGGKVKVDTVKGTGGITAISKSFGEVYHQYKYDRDWYEKAKIEAQCRIETLNLQLQIFELQAKLESLIQY